MSNFLANGGEIDEESLGFDVFLKKVCKGVGETTRRETFAMGLPIVYMKNGKIVKEFADGKIENN